MSRAALAAHLATGATHLCHCWSVVRRDGFSLGFTDHDGPLRFDDVDFRPRAGLSALALSSGAGLSVDNSAAVGVLSDDAITEGDILAGRYDGATVTVWQVCWDDPALRRVTFRGTIGEITRTGGGFEAELQGLTAPLNQTIGRSYQRECSAALGDGSCKVATAGAAFSYQTALIVDAQGSGLVVPDGGFAEGWFAQGLCRVVSGAGEGLQAAIRDDVLSDGQRRLTLWTPVAARLQAGDSVILTAGCDKTAATCRGKFDNLLNFQGFPDMPGEDWLVSVPRSAGRNGGGSLFR